MGLDRIDYDNTAVPAVDDLTTRAREFLRILELATDVPVQFVGTGFGTFEAITVQTPHIDLCHA